MNQKNGLQEAMKPFKRITFLSLASAFPMLCYIVLARMHLYSPDCMLGGQQQITEWRRLQMHAKTLHAAERLTLRWPRFVHIPMFRNSQKFCILRSKNNQSVIALRVDAMLLNKQVTRIMKIIRL